MREVSGKSIPETADGQGPTEEAIRAELMTILASSELKDKPTLASFLRFVVEQSLAGYSHQIKGFTIATQVLGRRDDFDAVKDPTVRILAGKLRATLDRYYLVSGMEDPVRIEIPKGTYVPVFHSVVADGRHERVPSPGRPGGNMGGMAHGAAIAVLPFNNLTGDPEREHFVDGLTEELTAEIARYQDLRVVASQSTLRMKGVKINARELGRELNVRFFLEGSVRGEGACLKIGVRLIDTTTQMQLWGEQYRRHFTVGNVIQLQEEIAARVAAKIGGLYGIIPRKLTKESRRQIPKTFESYEALLRLHRYTLTLTRESFFETLEALEPAHRNDPDLGVGWSMLALLYADSNTLWLTDPEVTMGTAMAHARKGVLLEPQNQYARTILAYMHFLLSERDAFLREAERAIDLNPNSPMHTAFLGWAMALYGEWDRGRSLMERGIELNPYYPGWFHVAPCLFHYAGGRYEQAYEEVVKIQMPQLFWDPLLRAVCLSGMGDLDRAREAIRTLLGIRPDFPSHARCLLAYFVKSEVLMDGLFDGLRKAGLTV